jgi:hypothetical protein
MWRGSTRALNRRLPILAAYLTEPEAAPELLSAPAAWAGRVQGPPQFSEIYTSWSYRTLQMSFSKNMACSG